LLLALFHQFLNIQFFAHHKIELHPFQIHFLQIKDSIQYLHQFTLLSSLYIENGKFD
jgi:hypothetical protein